MVVFRSIDFNYDQVWVLVWLPTGKNKKVIGLMKDELVGKIMKESVAVRPEIVISQGCVEKKAKATN